MGAIEDAADEALVTAASLTNKGAAAAEDAAPLTDADAEEATPAEKDAAELPTGDGTISALETPDAAIPASEATVGTTGAAEDTPAGADETAPLTKLTEELSAGLTSASGLALKPLNAAAGLGLALHGGVMVTVIVAPKLMWPPRIIGDAATGCRRCREVTTARGM